MKNFFKIIIYFFVAFFTICSLIVLSIVIKKKKRKIIFGTTPIISNKYWSNALKEIGIESETLMQSYYSNINKKSDFDLYFDDLIPKIFHIKYIKNATSFFFVWLYIIKNAKMVVMPFSGIIFHRFFWKAELLLFRLNHIKIIVLPYGGDAYMYSKVRDKSLQNSLLISYPNAAKEEQRITNQVFFWSKYADIIFTGFMSCDGMPRWDITIWNYFHADENEWKKKKKYSMNNGINGAVKVIHTPNHQGFKGTKYLINAVEALQLEGLQVELILLEKIPNLKVRELMQEVDIMAEQFIATAYALSGIEGMLTGLPVMANLDNEVYTTVFRRYSFLNECPILSTTPETLKENLRLLITNPELRQELGELGRKYAEKYHSYEMAQYLFTHIFRKLDGEDIDLMNLFHPLKSEYVKNNYIKTPLVNNRYIQES